MYYVTNPESPRIDLPKAWQDCVKSPALHTISLAHYVIVYTRAWAGIYFRLIRVLIPV